MGSSGDARKHPRSQRGKLYQVQGKGSCPRAPLSPATHQAPESTVHKHRRRQAETCLSTIPTSAHEAQELRFRRGRSDLRGEQSSETSSSQQRMPPALKDFRSLDSKEDPSKAQQIHFQRQRGGSALSNQLHGTS